MISHKFKHTIRTRLPLVVTVYRRIKQFKIKNRSLYIMHREAYDTITKSRLFDNSYYLSTYPDVASSDIDPLLHYLHYGSKEQRRPTAFFCPSEYYKNYEDVRNAGMEAFYHWVLMGRFEGRQPQINGCTVLGDITNASNHAMWSGYQSLKIRWQHALLNRERKIHSLAFCKSFSGMRPETAIDKIDLTRCQKVDSPNVSIVIPCLNQGMYTLECLASICVATQGKASLEVIVVDNNSQDPIYNDLAKLPGLKYIRSDVNEGFGEACNKGVAESSGKYVLILNNDAQLSPETIDTLIETYETSPGDVGIVGPKVLSFDGTLQEAGCYIHADGSGLLIGFGGDPEEPRFNYTREVEYVSGVALFISRQDFQNVGGFDSRYSPAYCEDADLCLKIRQLGKSVLYEPNAVVAHHLSVTSNTISNDFKISLALRNKHRLVEKWQADLSEHSIRLIAFYLPQYHPIPENDRWWGKGFTEWRNVTKAIPNYSGHYQPRLPADLGYYDLRVSEVMNQQAALAKRYSLSGFCYYYYWFDGKRLLDKPLERLLETGEPDIPFCLCWANENWTRTWDGLETDVLMAQKYSESNDRAVIEDLARYFKLNAYIRVHGKPFIIVYRVKEFPDFKHTAEVWREYCRSIGIGEIFIGMAESFELSASPEAPSIYGCDITIEFPPHGMVHDVAMPVVEQREEYQGAVHDYENLALQYMTRKEAGFKRIRSVMVGWDNTPRRQDKSLVLENATPGSFQAWLEWTIQRTKEQNIGDERLIFINAWNEWCEGSYLEPDQRYGHAYLQAVKNALDSHYESKEFGAG